MKASGWAFEEVDAGKVVLVDAKGSVLTGTGKRHLEFPIHTEIMAARRDINCVVHTHAPTVNAFSSLDRDLHPISHDGVPFAYPQIPDSPRRVRSSQRRTSADRWHTPWATPTRF